MAFPPIENQRHAVRGKMLLIGGAENVVGFSEAAQANSRPQTMPASSIATSCSRATNLDINVWLKKKLEEKTTASAKLVAKN